MKARLIKATIAATLGMLVMGSVAAYASPAPARSHMKAVVVKVAHVATGGAYVTLSVVSTSTEKATATTMPMRYTWDLTTDGNFETPLSVNPTITAFYAQTASGMVTATVKALGGSAARGAMDSVTFSTLVPRGGQIQIKAVVVKVAHVATGGAYVTLSVIMVNSPKLTAFSVPMRYAWDLTTDGIFETPLSINPTITRFYAQTSGGTVTATVKALGSSAARGAMDSVTFSMLP